jgi:NADH/NAD ratio-sensing transcriptional regulator Rex
MNQKRNKQVLMPRPALQRMSIYYRLLMKAIDEEMVFISSDELG